MMNLNKKINYKRINYKRLNVSKPSQLDPYKIKYKVRHKVFKMQNKK